MVKTKPLVSVIMPVYEPGAYITRALESIVTQTYMPVEIIIVDDGSATDVSALVAPFAAAVRIIRQENAGPAAARNTGIRAAQGTYIAFLDHDDLWLPDKTEKQVSIMERDQSVGLVSSWVDYIQGNDDTHIIGHFTGIVPNADIRAGLRIRNVICGPSSTLVRRKCFEEVGYFDESMRGCEDRELWYRITGKYAAVVIPEALARYRFHAENAHRNVSLISTGQRTFIGKHRDGYAPLEYCKAMSYIHLDAAREYFSCGARLSSFVHSLSAALWYPGRCIGDDDKYLLAIKSIACMFGGRKA